MARKPNVKQHLNTHLETEDVAVSSNLLGPWDRLALDLDIERNDVRARLFDPERAMVWTGDEGLTDVVLASWLSSAPPISDLLTGNPPEPLSPDLALYTLPPIAGLQTPVSDPLAYFANGLELTEARWSEEPALGQEGVLLTFWRVAEPLELIPRPVVANPPPPGVYSGPRLAVFTHLLAEDGAHIAGDDGLWVVSSRCTGSTCRPKRLPAPTPCDWDCTTRNRVKGNAGKSWGTPGSPSPITSSFRLRNETQRLSGTIGPVEHKIAERLVRPAIPLHDDQPPVTKNHTVPVNIESFEILSILLAHHKALIVQVDKDNIGIGWRIALGGDTDDV
jgi:hypothetical protein